jgi:hypothetical protein
LAKIAEISDHIIDPRFFKTFDILVSKCEWATAATTNKILSAVGSAQNRGMH